jgi:deazaflavin-dependent oxidoreductase (nitroreductase family)
MAEGDPSASVNVEKAASTEAAALRSAMAPTVAPAAVSAPARPAPSEASVPVMNTTWPASSSIAAVWHEAPHARGGVRCGVPTRPKDAIAKVVGSLHRSVFSASNGRLLGRVAGMPVVMLTTTGRKSGQPRTTMLTSPVQEGDRIVLVASYGGDPHHPAWFLNLRDHPDVEVVTAGKRAHMRARVASAEEKERLWPEVTARYKGYRGYQERTTRDIPLVLLEPADAGA